MAVFVLVHGGGHGGWCYSKLAALLRAQGHLVHAPSLTGCGDRKHTLTPDTDLDMHITDIVNLLEYEDLREVVLAGHSYGGMVITGVADRAAERIARLVYLDAAHPADGESLRVVAPDSINPTYEHMWVENGVELVMRPAPGMARFFGVHDEADVAWTDARLTPHPWKCFSQPLKLRNGDRAARIPRTNINCTQSLQNSIPEARARQLAGGHNHEIDTGHDLMITEPEKVAEIMLALTD